MSPWFSIALCAVILTLLLGISSSLLKQGHLRAETARKITHLGMGCLCLSFPWIFHDAWPVQLLAGIAVVALLFVRLSPLRDSLGASLFSVNRLSTGEILFPFGVSWVFSMSGGDPATYTPPLLILTLADTAGALVGNKYGKRFYMTSGSRKSIEGSSAFFLTALACIAAPIYFGTSLSISELLTISISVALFCTIVEGAAGYGLDNLLLPVASYLLIDYYIDLPVIALVSRIFAMLGILGILLILRRWHTLSGGATLCAVLFGLASFALGGPMALLTAFILFGLHLWTHWRNPEIRNMEHGIDTLLAIALPTLFWLAIGRSAAFQHSTVPLLGFISAIAVLSSMLHAGTHLLTSTRTGQIAPYLVKPLIVTLPAWWLCVELPPHFYVFSTLICSVVAGIIFSIWRGTRAKDTQQAWWKLSLLGFVLNPMHIIWLSSHL